MPEGKYLGRSFEKVLVNTRVTVLEIIQPLKLQRLDKNILTNDRVDGKNAEGGDRIVESDPGRAPNNPTATETIQSKTVCQNFRKWSDVCGPSFVFENCPCLPQQVILNITKSTVRISSEIYFKSVRH